MHMSICHVHVHVPERAFCAAKRQFAHLRPEHPDMHTCMHIHMQRMCSMRMHAMFHMFRTNAPNNGGCGSSSKSVPVVDLRHSRRSAARLDLNTSCRPVSDKGFIPHADGVQLQEGLLRGKLGVDVDQMTGHRWFSNYESATTVGRAGVAAAVAKRVDSGKTLALGPMGHGLAQAKRCAYTSSCIFPMGPSRRRFFLVRPRTSWSGALQAIIPAPESTRPPT